MARLSSVQRVGHGQAGHRPVVVLSPAELAEVRAKLTALIER
jgi:mRNA-degrading endonuclease toxin of MazEF toxin-antitoxin module